MKLVAALPDRFMPRAILAGCLALLAVACATTSPFSELIRSRIDTAMTPERAVADYPASKNREVLWGGRILESRNLADSTEFTVLAYPLDSKGMPDLAGDVPFGRFIVEQKGYLETVTYAPGREITVYGRVVGVREAAVGKASHREPVVAAVQIHLWEPSPASRWPLFRFGVGVSRGV